MGKDDKQRNRTRQLLHAGQRNTLSVQDERLVCLCFLVERSRILRSAGNEGGRQLTAQGL